MRYRIIVLSQPSDPPEMWQGEVKMGKVVSDNCIQIEFLPDPPVVGSFTAFRPVPKPSSTKKTRGKKSEDEV